MDHGAGSLHTSNARKRHRPKQIITGQSKRDILIHYVLTLNIRCKVQTLALSGFDLCFLLLVSTLGDDA